MATVQIVSKKRAGKTFNILGKPTLIPENGIIEVSPEDGKSLVESNIGWEWVGDEPENIEEKQAEYEADQSVKIVSMKLAGQTRILPVVGKTTIPANGTITVPYEVGANLVASFGHWKFEGQEDEEEIEEVVGNESDDNESEKVEEVVEDNGDEKKEEVKETPVAEIGKNEDTPEDNGGDEGDDNEGSDEDIEATLNAMELADLKSFAKESGFPEEEWKGKRAKNTMIKYIMDKIKE